MRWAGHEERVEKTRNAYRVFVGKPERNRPLGRPVYRMEDNIRMDLGEVGWGMDWIYLPKARDQWKTLVKKVMNLGFH
jgi:hypothetical protein